MIDQQHLDLAPVTGIDQTGRIHQPDSAGAGMPAAWKHEAGVARWDGDRDPGRDCSPLPRKENDLAASLQIEARVALVSGHRRRYTGIEHPEGNLHRLDQI